MHHTHFERFRVVRITQKLKPAVRCFGLGVFRLVVGSLCLFNISLKQWDAIWFREPAQITLLGLSDRGSRSALLSRGLV